MENLIIPDFKSQKSWLGYYDFNTYATLQYCGDIVGDVTIQVNENHPKYGKSSYVRVNRKRVYLCEITEL
jgi:hypothetical protein